MHHYNLQVAGGGGTDRKAKAIQYSEEEFGGVTSVAAEVKVKTSLETLNP